VLPYIAIGREMRDRGHDVILYANPYFRGYVTAAGLQFVPISTVDEYSRLFGELAESDPKKALQRVSEHFSEICNDYYNAMKTDVVAGQTITIGNSLLFAPRLLRETDGIPCAAVHLAPCVIRSSIKPARLAPNWIHANTPALIKRMAWWATDKLYYDPFFTKPLNKLRSELGLPPVKNIFRSWIHEADCVVALFPEWFSNRQGDWPSQIALTGFPLYDSGAHSPLPGELIEFIEAGPAPVAFSAGTANANAKNFFETSVEACRLAGIRGILVSHFSEQIPLRLPPDIVHVAYAPFGALLPRLSAFVHHGGIGSTSQALRAGVPQLIRPVAYDQFDNSARAVELGVARELLPKQYSARSVADVLSYLTSDVHVRERCKEITTSFVHGRAVQKACDVITSHCVAVQ
jgi:UDP:flavonoid glycosyltransferase YjiC (YdhE family)